MKKRVLTSVVASAVLAGMMMFTGCGSSSNGGSTSGGSTSGGSTSGGSTSGGSSASSAMIRIQTGNGQIVNVDPTTGGTVVISRNNDSSQQIINTVLGTPLNDCANATSDSDGDGVICGPKEGVTYVFQADFGALGPVDNDPNTPDGGVLLYDALTKYNNTTFTTLPLEGNSTENRIQEVYIPTNYIVLTDDKKNASVDEQYETMKEHLTNIGNLQCFIQEDNASMSNNPYFTDGKDTGRFVATFVMHFTRGTGESALMEQFKTDKTDLEYLAVSFELDVSKVDGNSSKLRFTVPSDTPVDFLAKKAGGSGLVVTTSNIDLNSIVHQTVDADHAVTINMAKYFNKLIAKGDSIGVSDFAKKILVENAQHPWPVKIYGTLVEIDDNGNPLDPDGRSFVRNPAKLDADLFGLTQGGAYKNVFVGTPLQAVKFNLVYPGGKYNTLED
jgi:hypothetical protein